MSHTLYVHFLLQGFLLIPEILTLWALSLSFNQLWKTFWKISSSVTFTWWLIWPSTSAYDQSQVQIFHALTFESLHHTLSMVNKILLYPIVQNDKRTFYLITGPFIWDLDFWPSDIDLKVWPTLKKNFNLGYSSIRFLSCYKW